MSGERELSLRYLQQSFRLRSTGSIQKSCQKRLRRQFAPITRPSSLRVISFMKPSVSLRDSARPFFRKRDLKQRLQCLLLSPVLQCNRQKPVQAQRIQPPEYRGNRFRALRNSFLDDFTFVRRFVSQWRTVNDVTQSCVNVSVRLCGTACLF